MRTKLPLLLIAGLLDDAQLWEHQIQHLQDLCQPLVVDNSRDTTMQALAERVLNTTPGRFAVAGMSMGGYAALEVMDMAPERVAGLALVNTSARADDDVKSRWRQRQIKKAKRDGFEALLTSAIPTVVHASKRTDVALMKTIFTMARRTGIETYLRQQTAIESRVDRRETLASILCPTLVIVGREDTLTPPVLAQEMVAGISRARLGLIEQCGHYSPMEHPQAVTALMRVWLNEVLADE